MKSGAPEHRRAVHPVRGQVGQRPVRRVERVGDGADLQAVAPAKSGNSRVLAVTLRTCRSWNRCRR